MSTFPLFPEGDPELPAAIQAAAAEVPGLRVTSDFVSPAAEAALLAAIDASPWLDDLARRVQHYGWRYAYRARKVDASQRLGPLPPWAAKLATRLHAECQLPHVPDQLIVNEYEPGQGISKHVDVVTSFADGIASLTLGSGCVMTFAEVGGAGKVNVFLPPRSLVVLSGPARYGWTHAISKRKTDRFAGRALPRGRRVSLTFRLVLQSG